MMINFDQSVKINYNPNLPDIPDHPYKILITGGFESGKTDVLLSLIKHQRLDFDKICLYVKNPSESKYQLLINRREKIRTENLKNAKVFTDYSQTINDVYENLEDYYPTKKTGVLIAFDDMIADMEFEALKSVNCS